jgi:hypothetical protein
MSELEANKTRLDELFEQYLLLLDEYQSAQNDVSRGLVDVRSTSKYV